jgi:hypothetical protein
MRNRYGQVSVTVLSLAAGALLLAAATDASALNIKSGSDKVDLKLKGHINRAVMFADNGDESKTFHVDNTNSESRIGLYGKVKASDDMAMGGTFEVQWQANPSDKVSMEEETVAGEFKERIMEVWLAAEGMGKFSLGRGDMSSDDSSEVDLSGTDLAGNVGVADVGGGIAFHDSAAIVSDANAEDNRVTVGNVFDQMDGLSRRNRVRYDTPNFAGFSLGASAGEKEMVDATLLYSQDFGGAKFKAALAWSNPGEDKDYSQINGSASLLFNCGFNLTAAGGTRDLDNMPAGGDDPTFMYGKAGYIFKQLVPVGSTAVSVDYGAYENVKKQDISQKGTAAGVQLVQKLSDWSTDLFAAYRAYQLEDDTSADYDDISIVMGGARFKF